MSALERLGQHWTFKSLALWSVRDSKGFSCKVENLMFGINEMCNAVLTQLYL
jgi:hypothetical protein